MMKQSDGQKQLQKISNRNVHSTREEVIHLYLVGQRRQIAILLLISLIAYGGYGFACSASDVHKVKVKVDQAASILNAAAKSNRELYRSGVYGTVGSAEAIAKRQKVATGIHAANEYLSDAVEVAANLQPGMSGKAVFDLLTQAAQQIVHLRVGNDRIDVVIQSAVTAINSAIILAQAIKEK